MCAPQARKQARPAMGRVGSGVRRPSARRPEVRIRHRTEGVPVCPSQPPLPAIRSRSDRASPPTTGDRASLASSRFAKVRDRPGARVSSAQGTRAAGNVSQGAAFTYPEPWRFRKASGSIVSVRPPWVSRSGFPDASFFQPARTAVAVASSVASDRHLLYYFCLM
jgi:hypothetical protein